MNAKEEEVIRLQKTVSALLQSDNVMPLPTQNWGSDRSEMAGLVVNRMTQSYILVHLSHH